MKTLTLAFLATWLGFALNFAQAQSPEGKIFGQVLDDHKQPAIAATVVLVTAKDSATVKTGQADAQGRFVFSNIGNGAYRLQVRNVGFKTYRSDVVYISTEKSLVNLTPITLQPGGTTLKEVAVTAQKSYIEQKVDRMVVNVGSSITNTGANALEALEKAPGVIVDVNGGISFKGKSSVMILIDDKPTYLSGDDLINYLKSIPASHLDQIELMTNPPAKYDASGNAGIINIKTKHSKIKGFNGSAAANAGLAKYWRTSESFNMNYRVDKINFFLLEGYSIQNSYRRLDVGRTYFDAGNNVRSSYTEVAFFNPSFYNSNLKTGVDYYISPKTTLGVVLSGVISTGDNHNPVNSFLKNAAGKIDSTVVAENNTNYKNYNGGINFNYSHKYDSLGTNITADFDYVRYSNHRDQSFYNTTYNASGALGSNQNIIDNLPVYVNIWSGKTDYSLPFNKKTRLDLGLKTSYVNTDNAANYFNIVNNVTTVDNNNTNRFIYKENVNAAYANFSQEWKRFSLQAGLRAENTRVNAHQLGNALGQDSSFVKNYTDLFPTAFVLYKLDSAGSNSVSVSYGRRIDRPAYQDLNPFIIILDKYSAFTGNPFLRPQFTNNYQLSYSYKSMLVLSAGYSYVTDYRVEYDYQKGDIFFANSINLGSRAEKNVAAITNLDPFKWWHFYLDAEYNWTRYKGQLGTIPVDNTTAYCFINNTNQFTLSHGWSAELTMFYVSPFTDSQFTHIARKQLNMGLQKKILNNNGAIKLSARDLFKGNYSAGNIRNVPGAAITYHNDNANRSVTLGFSYNFGKSANIPKKRNTGSADSEKNRAGN
ncbi:TonB-dependent receptor [Mucilaginibacter boryungensis]|uniref:TonB-dependent receptor n=1 Tax=Mucilaginibacter boryungensis TaxID=768480 RepID=A0ABR9XIZ3_9SPHI|nr:TonB-dependent receptor [Mucilaginibacter boryungensis]MBE9667347.1 TonB-dependent receptor [Mucilaginibacter boryungensis]